MSINITQYRAAIGLFNLRSAKGGKTYFNAYIPNLGSDPLGTGKNLVFSIVICIYMISLSMDIEPHPGPITELIGNISICHLNIRSLNANSRLEAFLTQIAGEYDIITVSESWLNETHSNETYIIDGYSGPYRLDRTLQPSGGVMAWVTDSIIVKPRIDLQIFKLEVLWLELCIPRHRLLVATCYRQQDGTYGDYFWDKIQTSYDQAKATNIPNIVLIGDFNADPQTDKTAAENLDFFLATNHLTQHIDKPTRYTPTRATKLDLIISNIPSLIANTDVLEPVHYNDHCTIIGEITYLISKRKAYQRTMWDFQNANFDGFRHALSEYNWDHIFENNDIDETCETWTEIITNMTNTFVPHRSVTVRPNDKTWYNGYLRRLKKQKFRDHRKAIRLRTNELWETFRNSRNFYFAECARIKLEHEEKLTKNLAAETKTKPKEWWSLAKQIMGNSKTSTFPAMTSEGQIYDTDEGKADLFNNYFLGVTRLPNDPDNLPEPEVLNLTENTLEDITITEQDVTDILKILKTDKAYGPDGISPRVLKEIRPQITTVLTKIFNMSLLKGVFPALWKKANVIPIFKSAEQFIASNYRPISLLPTIAKVFEKIIFKYLYNFFRDNFLISVWQSGFLPGSSTVTQLVEIYDQFCKAVTRGKDIRVVFLDISKAFDRVWHLGLITKLKAHGIRGRLLAWLINYLKDRQQRVLINGIHSDWGNIEAGVPQGSVLGPLLFLIFINDITFVTKFCKIRLFADDTCLFIEVDNPNTAAESLNTDLEAINEWAKTWQVTFSPPKTEDLIITNKRNRPHPPLYLNDQLIKTVTSHKHLGLIISKDLSWKLHVQEIAKKANKCLGILRPLRSKIDRKSLEIMYKSFVRPVMEYGDVIWHIPDIRNHTLEILDKVHYNAARLVTGAPARTRSIDLFKEIGWETLADRRTQHRASLMHNIMNARAPSYLLDLIPDTVGARNQYRYQLRNRGDLEVPLARISTYSNSFFPASTRLWNQLPVTIKNSPSHLSFKHNYLKQFPRPITSPLYYLGPRREAIAHARMRMGCSPLNAHLHYYLHVIESPACSCNMGVEENADHYLLVCPIYNIIRQVMFNDLVSLGITKIDTDLLLYGNADLQFPTNQAIFKIVHQYITDTARFLI